MSPNTHTHTHRLPWCRLKRECAARKVAEEKLRAQRRAVDDMKDALAEMEARVAIAERTAAEVCRLGHRWMGFTCVC